MAFSFGQPQQPAAAPAPAFGGFGATPAPASGPPATPSLFGAPAASAAPTPGLFGSAPAPAPLFGAAVSTAPGGGLFGAAQQPAAPSAVPPTPGLFGAPPASSSAFGAPPASATSLFGAQPPAFGLLGVPPATAGLPPASAGGLFGAAAQPPPPQQPQPAAAALVTKDGRPATHGTQWDELAPGGQAFLLELERTVASVREAAAALESDGPLFDSAARAAAPSAGRRALEGELARLGARVRSDAAAGDALRSDALGLLRGAEAAVRGFQRADARAAAARAGAVGAALPPGVRDALAAAPPGPPDLPSRYLRTAVADLASSAGAQAALAGELERLVGSGAGDGGREGEPDAAALASALHAAHATLLHVAARVEHLHERVGSVRAAHTAALRARGVLVGDDPFGSGQAGGVLALAAPAPAAPSLLFGGGGR